MDIPALLKRLLILCQAVVILVAVSLAKPAIRFREPEFEPAPGKVTYRKSDKARLFCSVKHLGERTVVWRKVPDKNPLTIGTTTWIEDSRISVDHSSSSNQWDLVIENVTLRDMGSYECQVSISKKLLRHVVELRVTEITISGTQFVSRGDNVTLFCNASKAGNPRRVLLWLKGSQEVIQDGDRITVNVDSENRDLIVSKLRIQKVQSDDSGLYTCQALDEMLMTSAYLNVLIGSSNNVKRAGSSSVTQESGAVLGFHSFISHSRLVLLMLIVHNVTT